MALIYNGKEIPLAKGNIIYNGTEVMEVKYGNTTVWGPLTPQQCGAPSKPTGKAYYISIGYRWGGSWSGVDHDSSPGCNVSINGHYGQEVHPGSSGEWYNGAPEASSVSALIGPNETANIQYHGNPSINYINYSWA